MNRLYDRNTSFPWKLIPMGLVLSAGIALPILVSALLGPSRTTVQAAPSYRIVGYYTSYSVYNSRYLLTDIPTSKLTHLNYAFVNLSPEGTCIVGDEWADTQYPYPGDKPDEPLRGNFKQLLQIKKATPSLSILMSIGGWSWSQQFSDAALTQESRARFAQSCISFMKRYGFNGIDIDWEFPVSGGLHEDRSRPEDRSNFTLLLAELRRQLDSEAARDQSQYFLSAALPTDQNARNFELDQIHGYLDWLNLMTYTLPGGGQHITGLLAPLYPAEKPADATLTADRVDTTVDEAIKTYQAAGVPASKLVVGVGFLGFGWEEVPDRNRGLYQPFARLADTPAGDGIYRYADLSATYIKEYPRHWEAKAQVPWLYNSATRKMISYEDPQSLQAKVNYVKAQGLGGMMVWELGYDDRQHTLLNVLSGLQP